MPDYKAILKCQPDVIIFNVGCTDGNSFDWNEDNFEDQFVKFVESFAKLRSSPKIYMFLPAV